MNEQFWPTVREDSDIPKYKQIVNAIIDGIKSGKYTASLQIPSLNEMTESSGASKETVYKAYAYLNKVGAIKSHRGKGYFICDNFFKKEKNILAILPDTSPNMMVVLKSFWETIGSYAKVTTVFHNMNPEMLKKYLYSEYGHYDYFLVVPHFPSDKISVGQIAGILKYAPAAQTVIVDRFLPNLDQNYGMSYQFIYADVLHCLENMADDFKNYKCLKSAPFYTSLYGEEIEDALHVFCKKIRIPYERSHGRVPDKLSKGDVLFIYGCSLGSGLVELYKLIEQSGLKPGKDIGIICYDDFQINEIILGGLSTMSADYAQMGTEAAKMMIGGKLGRVHCDFNIIRRNSF